MSYNDHKQHNNSFEQQGGTVTERYHLSEDQYNFATATVAACISDLNDSIQGFDASISANASSISVNTACISVNKDSITLIEGSLSTYAHASLNNVVGSTHQYHISADQYDWIGQDVRTTASPTFEAVTATSFDAATISATLFNAIELIFNTLSTYPNGEVGSLMWNDDDGTLDLVMKGGEVIQQIGEETYLYVKASGAISNGRLCTLVDNVGNSGQIVCSHFTPSSLATNLIVGVATENIADNEFGFLTAFGVVRGTDTSGDVYGEVWNDFDVLYPSMTISGGLTNIKPTGSYPKTGLAVVLNAASSGTLFVRITRHSYITDLTNVDSTEATSAGEYLQWNGMYYSPTLNASLSTVTVSSLYATVSQLDTFVDSKDPRGWVDNTSITVSYDATNNLVVLDGDLKYRWNGVLKTLGDGVLWTSSTHAADDATYYLYTSDGENFSWATTPWEFSDVQIAAAIVTNSGTDKFCLNEPHGLMPWQVHDEFHNLFGTYRVSGLGVTDGTYTFSSATDADITPAFDSGVIKDEDIETTIASTTQSEYRLYSLGAGDIGEYTTATLPYKVGTNYPLINTSGGVETETSTKKYFNVYELLLPTTPDTVSASYSRLLVQPQYVFSTEDAAVAEEPSSVNLGNLTSIAPESILYTRLTYYTNAGYGSTGKTVIATVSQLAGTRYNQTSVVGGSTPTAENISYTPTTPDTSLNVQTALDARVLVTSGTVSDLRESTNQITFASGLATLTVSECQNSLYTSLTQNSTLTLAGTFPEGKSITLEISHDTSPWTLAVGTSGNEADVGLTATATITEGLVMYKMNGVIRYRLIGEMDGVLT